MSLSSFAINLSTYQPACINANRLLNRSLFNVQGGLIGFNFRANHFGKADDDDDDGSQHVFSLENGDDWFYFEDTSESSLAQKSDSMPFQIGTISGTETEVFRLKYKSQPKHTVLHKGACSFTGIDTSAGSDSSKSVSHGHTGVSVQVNMEDL